MKKIYSSKSLIAKYLIFAELVGLGIIVLLPIIYIVGASFAKQSGLPTTFWPRNLTLENYRILFDESETMFVHWYKNTFFLALLNMVFGVLFITGAAYIFARFKFKGKKIGLITILVLQVFPSFMGMVALFTLYQTFNLVGRPLALTFIYVGGSVPFNLWLIKGYLQQIPRDLDESAMLDGANKAQIFFKIILPLSVPILSFVAVSQFMAPWMDYILPSFLLNIVPRNANIPAGMNLAEYTKMQWTLAVGLFEFISGTNSEYTTFAAGAIIVALPITVLYMLFQRFLIQGITAGATKG
ncbi:MAG TPA: sugar ABC transporter permease [Bacilli bacterium]|nr:sugar ABC transporter permease [Bacilli bacterium]